MKLNSIDIDHQRIVEYIDYRLLTQLADSDYAVKYLAKKENKEMVFLLKWKRTSAEDIKEHFLDLNINCLLIDHILDSYREMVTLHRRITTSTLHKKIKEKPIYKETMILQYKEIVESLLTGRYIDIWLENVYNAVKKCNVCKVNKSIHKYYANKNYKDNRDNTCKECRKKEQKNAYNAK